MEILYSLIAIEIMGARLQKAIARCCQYPSAKGQTEEGGKVGKSKTKIVVIPANDNNEQLTDINFANKQSELHLQSTASTNAGFAHNKTSSAFVDLDVNDIRINEIGTEKVYFQTVKILVQREVMRIFMVFFEEKYGMFEENKEEDGVWRKTKTGSYVFMKDNKFVCFFSHSAYYEGEIKRDEHGSYLPHGNGILILQQGLYQGNFINGKADGQGEFIQNQTRTSFDGLWTNGTFVKGVVQNSGIIFRGQMVDGLANGNGSLFFKKDYEQYIGSFKNGLYDGERSIILSRTSTFIGNFRAGKKEGKGVLYRQQQNFLLNTKSLKVKSYIPPVNLVGMWSCDTFTGSSPENLQY